MSSAALYIPLALLSETVCHPIYSYHSTINLSYYYTLISKNYFFFEFSIFQVGGKCNPTNKKKWPNILEKMYNWSVAITLSRGLVNLLQMKCSIGLVRFID